MFDPMITTLMVACAIVAWEPGENALEHDVYEDMIYEFTTKEPEMEICRLDYDREYTYYVVGVKDDSESVPSETLTVKWVFDFDTDDNEIVNFADFGAFVAAFGTTDPRFDADDNGTVGFSDFGKFIQRFGECNEGQRVVVPCPVLPQETTT